MAAISHILGKKGNLFLGDGSGERRDSRDGPVHLLPFVKIRVVVFLQLLVESCHSCLVVRGYVHIVPWLIPGTGRILLLSNGSYLSLAISLAHDG